MTLLDRLALGKRSGTAAIVVALLVGLAVRTVWPGADPAPRLSWSGGIFTDPPANTIAARNAVLFGDWNVEDSPYRYTYPVMEGLTWLAYRVFGVSRATTNLLAGWLGSLGLALTVGALLRSSGRTGALAGAVLGAVCYWHVMFSRIPVTENGVALLLAAAVLASLGRGTRDRALAGALAAIAVFFGKYHAIGFLPGFLVFVALRARRVRALLPVALAGGAIVLVWLFTLFLPHQAEILAHVERQSIGTHGMLPILASPLKALTEPLNTVRQGWMLFQMPVTGALGGIFAIWTLGNPSALRRRVRDGTAVFAFWLGSMWIYYSLLPYKAPRYYVLLALPLIACAACQIVEMARSEHVLLRRPRRWGEWLPVIVWLLILGFAVIDGIRNYASIALTRLATTHDVTVGWIGVLLWLHNAIGLMNQNLRWGLALSAVLLVAVAGVPGLVSRGRKPARFTFLPAAAGALLVLGVGVNLILLGHWAANRTYTIEETGRSLDTMISDDAVVFGNFAPLLTQDTHKLGIPYFESLEEEDLLGKYGVTHIALGLPRGLREFESRYPGLLEQLHIIQSWPFSTTFVRHVNLYRLPDGMTGDYVPTSFERGVDDVQAGRHEPALRNFREYRDSGGEETADLLSYEAVSWSALGEDETAERLLRKAIALRPKDPLLHRNLGALAFRKGDTEEARELWIRGLRLDPVNEELAALIRTHLQ